MANFTFGIKRELLAKKLNDKACQTASLSAFVRTSGCISYTQEGLGFFLVTESERIAEYYLSLIEKLYGVSCTANAAADRLSGKDKLTIAYNGEAAYDILIDLGIFQYDAQEGCYALHSAIPKNLIEQEECAISYIRGAFLGGGSCTLPRKGAKTGYHLEFVFTQTQTAHDFAALLEEYQLIAKVVKRKERAVVYVTSVAAISDFLAVVGAQNSLERLNLTAEEREENNNSNRVNNCFVGNMDRTATAAAKQGLAIEYLEKGGFLAKMEEEVKIVAKARQENREASLAELAKQLQISKSCINHRMRKLLELYEDIKKSKG